MKIPRLLQDLHEYLKNTLNIDQETMTWEYSHEMYNCHRSLTKKHKKELLLEAQQFLSPLADEERCRHMKEKWRNIGYCPESPIGSYIWTFQCELVQELLWLYPEFVQGYSHGVNQKIERSRDANPYHDISRNISWDRGYILGLNVNEVNRWLMKKTP